MAGIVVSTILGTAAQLKESADDAAQALTLAKKTDTTLLEIKRNLAPLDEVSVSMDLDVDCTDERYVDFCKKTKALREKRWLYFDDMKNLFPHHDDFKLVMRFDIFVDPKDAQKSLSDLDNRGDWVFYAGEALHQNEDGTIDLQQMAGNKIRLSIFSAKATNAHSNGKLNSLIDLPNTTCILSAGPFNDMLKGLITQYLAITIKNGQSIGLTGPFTPISIAGARAYIFKLPAPKTDKAPTSKSNGSPATPTPG